jgi:hypothetical protein
VKKICRKNAIDITLAELFPTNNINGHALLKLTKEDLKNIGISSYGHIIQFYVCTKKIRTNILIKNILYL